MFSAEVDNEDSSADIVSEVPEGLTANEIIKQLAKSLQDSTSSLLVHRNVCFLKHYIVTSNERTTIKDLPYLSVVLNYICCEQESNDEYNGPMFHLLYMLSKPPHFQKVSDCLKSDVILKNYINSLGGLVVKLVGEPFLQKCILNIMYNLLVREAPESKTVIGVDLYVNGLVESSLCKELSKLVSLNVNHNLIEVLHIIINVQTLSNQCSFRFLSHNLHNYLLLYLEDTKEYKNCDLNNLIVRNLWLLLEAIQLNPHQIHRKIKPPSIKGIRHLVDLLMKGKSSINRTRASKRFRNSIAAIILKLIHLFPNVDVTQLNILDDVVSLLMMHTPKRLLKNVEYSQFLRSDQEMFNFVKILLFNICFIMINSTKYEILQIKTEAVMQMLVEFLVPWNTHFMTLWDETQVKEFLNISLKMIPLILPIHANKFISEKGIQRIMVLLELFKYDTIGIDLFQRVAKTFHRTYDFFLKMSLVKTDYKNRLLIVQEYVEFTLIIDLCKRILYTDAMSLAYQQILTHLLCALQLMLMWYDSPLSNSTTSSLLELVHSCLDRIISPNEGDSFISNRLQVIIADFVWTFLTQSQINCTKFIQSNGVYKILDVLESCLFPIKIIHLSILVDLCETPISIPYLLTWRGGLEDKKTDLIKLLCKLWRTQEHNDNVKRDKSGCIEDTERSLMGAYQFALKIKWREPESSPSLVCMLGNVRPKIYAIIHLLEKCNKDITDIVKEQYGTSLEIETYDEVTLLLIRNFYKLKCGEIWQEMDGDYTYNLPPDKLTPLYRDIIHTFAIAHVNLSHHIQTSQQALIKMYKEKIEKENENFFIVHNDSQFAPAMKALHEIRFNARIEKLSFLTQAKEDLERKINDCRIVENIHNTIPSTYPQNLRLTTMSAAREKILMKQININFRQDIPSPSRDSIVVSPPSPVSSLNTIEQILVNSMTNTSFKRESLCKTGKRGSSNTENNTIKK